MTRILSAVVLLALVVGVIWFMPPIATLLAENYVGFPLGEG